MASVERETPIALLPEEVFCMIFDLLDLMDVKNASLTCCRWHNIIFLSGYIKRFKFKIEIPFKTNDESESKMWLSEVIDTVTHTQRCYRNMCLIIGTYLESNFPTLWKSLRKKITKHITTLELTFNISHANGSVYHVLPIIDRQMKKLSSLTLTPWDDSDYCCVLVNPSLKHLKMAYADDITVSTPELQSFEGSLFALAHDFSNGPSRVLTNLKHVTLIDTFDFSDASNFDRFVHVETLVVRDTVFDDFFIAMCDKCVALKELSFGSELRVDDPATIRHLTKLVSLRRLQFSTIENDRSCFYEYDFDLSALTSTLEQLHLGLTDLWCSVRFPLSIRFLTVAITKQSERNVMKCITDSLKHLQKLCLVYENPCRKVAKSTLKSLHLIQKLEVLVFVRAQFSQSGFLDMDAPLHRLRKLRFEDCECDPTGPQGLHQMFPNLKQLEFPSPYTSMWRDGFTDAD